MIEFYTSHCPKCKVLKQLMDRNKIEYIEIDNEDIYIHYKEGETKETEDVIEANILLKEIVTEFIKISQLNINSSEQDKMVKLLEPKLDEQLEQLQTLLSKGNYLVKFDINDSEEFNNKTKYFTL